MCKQITKYTIFSIDNKIKLYVKTTLINKVAGKVQLNLNEGE